MGEHDHQGQPCQLVIMSAAMYGVVERRAGFEDTRAVILLSEPGRDGHDSIAVFGYPAEDHPVQRVIEDMAHQLIEFGDSFSEHIDIYVNGVRLGTGRASPNAS